LTSESGSSNHIVYLSPPWRGSYRWLGVRNAPAAGKCHARISACLPYPPLGDWTASLPGVRSPANASLQDRGGTRWLRPPNIWVPEVRSCSNVDHSDGPNEIERSRVAWRRTQAAPI